MATEPETRPPEAPGPSRRPLVRLIVALRGLLSRFDAWLQARLGGEDTPRAAKGRSSSDLAEDRTLLATGRTLMAADRSLMAWMRTALSMQSFGFTIYKLLQGLQESGQLATGQSPRTIGLFLTFMGTVAILAGTVDYLHTLKQLRQFHRIRLWRPSFVFAVAMILVGVFLFFSIILKVF